MKKIAIISVVLTLLLSSCEEYLSYTEQSFFDDPEYIFNNFDRTQKYLTHMYSRLPVDYNSVGGAMRSAACDEAEYVKQSSSIQDFNNGQWASTNALDNKWAHYYQGIRSANFFLQEIEGRTYEDYQYNNTYEDDMARFHYYPYEARFLRAFFYFELAKRYGDIPLVTTVNDDVEEMNNIEKTPFHDIITFIVDECDAVKDSLPVSWSGKVFQETGRVTQGAVYALKSRVLLYAASPLHNPDKDIEKWKAAAIAANEFFNNENLNYSFAEEYYNSSNMAKGVFNNIYSSELIFECRQGKSNGFEKSNFPKGFDGANGNSTCPSQNLVDAYRTSDGFNVILNENGNWTAPGSSVFDPEKPYQNRDPRLLQTVMVNGDSLNDIRVETFVGGAHGAPNPDVSPTAYYLKKYVRQDLKIAGSDAGGKDHAWVIFRLTEMYLNLAEAMNEAYGPNEIPPGFSVNATLALNVVITRPAVGMPGIFGLSKGKLRSEIIHERRVELAFEDHRFWDIRRWRLLDSDNPDKISEDLYGIEITNTGGTLSYSEKLVDDRIWDDKMYLYPFPYMETVINSNLGQNTGW